MKNKKCKWYLTRVFAPNSKLPPEIEEDWEPFGIQTIENGCWIWLRKKEEQ